MFDDDNQKSPFLVPFLIALAFGIPVSAAWYLIAMNAGFLANAITVLLGCACGFGARIAARGWHPAEAAMLSTLALITLSISVVTIALVASEIGESILTTVVTIVIYGDFTDFANACVLVAGKTFISYPIGLYAAYRASNGS